MAELKDHLYEKSASTATCRKELLQEQKNFAAAKKERNVSSVRVVAVAKERDDRTAKYKMLRSSMDQLLNFAIKKMARLKAEIIKMTQE